MITVLIDATTAVRLSEPKTTVDVRTEDGKLIGVFTPRREATPEDYEWARQQFTPEEIERARNSGPGRPLVDIMADLRKRTGA